MSILKDLLLILLGAGMAYLFDLIKRYSEKKDERRSELSKQCNELIMLCNKLFYFTEKWYDNFLHFHYYQQLHYRSSDPTISDVMVMTHKDTNEINEKIADLIIRVEYCFNEIHRLDKIEFGSDEAFITDYKLESNNQMFNEIASPELKDFLDKEIKKAESIMKDRYKPVFERVKQKANSLRI
jgi:hypothetical protein